jgi:hypothetical protein
VNRRTVAAVVLIAVAEFAWLAWFLIVPLPNANSIGVPPEQAIRRGLLMLKAFPQVVPETSFRQSILGNALEELSHLENLPQRLPILLVAGLIAAAAIALGDLVLSRLGLASGLGTAERIALDYGLGTALLGIVILLCGRVGWLNPVFFRLAIGALALLGFVRARPWRYRPPRLTASGCTLLIVAFPFISLMILGAMLPSIDFDVLEYHLQGPKEYFQTGRINFLPHNVYTSMPFGIEMLHLAAMEVMGDWWWGGLAGQVLVALFAPATAVLIASAATFGGSWRAGWVAAIVYLTTPWIYRLAVLAYVEGPLCFYHGALVWATVRLVNDRERARSPVWTLMGLLAGGAMACKYPALISAVIPFGALAVIDAWRARTNRAILCYIAGWAIVAGPWLAKNVVDTGNPVYPLANSIFHGQPWDEAREQKWTRAHGRRPVTARELGNGIVDVAGRSDWQSPLYVALAPLAFLRFGSRRLTAGLWGYVVYLFATWWLFTHRLDRFWLPLLPPFAMLAGLGADWVRNRAWTVALVTIMAFGLVINLTYISTALAGLNEWTGDLVVMRKDLPRRWNAALARLDSELPPDAHPLLVGQAAVFHLNHRVAFNTVFDPEIIETLASGKSDPELVNALRERNLTHIYVDWKEIDRHRKPGGYGFTDFVQPSRFAHWVSSGVLEAPIPIGPEQELYRVR